MHRMLTRGAALCAITGLAVVGQAGGAHAATNDKVTLLSIGLAGVPAGAIPAGAIPAGAIPAGSILFAIGDDPRTTEVYEVLVITTGSG